MSIDFHKCFQKSQKNPDVHVFFCGISDMNRLNQAKAAPYSHSLVDLNALLVLEAGLGQVNRKHTCDPNQAGHTPINQLSREAAKGSTWRCTQPHKHRRM